MPTDKNIELTISDDHASAPPKAAKKILDVAYDLFYRRGIRAIGVDEIVKRAGVTKPSLYRSFPVEGRAGGLLSPAIRSRILGAFRRGGRRPIPATRARRSRLS